MTNDFLRNSFGNLAIIAALSVVPLAGAAGVAVDLNRIANSSENLQASLDAGVLAGASAPINKTNSAKKMFEQNLHTENIKLNSVEFSLVGASKIIGKANVEFAPSISSILGFKSTALTLSSAANYSLGSDSLCILALAPTTAQAFLINSGANLSALKCEVHVSSKSSPAAIFNSGTTLNTAKICIAGSSIIDNGGSHPNLTTGCSTASDPYAGKIAAPLSGICDYSNMNYSGNVVLSPGTYCGWMNFNSGSNVTLSAGTYVIKSGGWNVNGGTWVGNGVTFYFADTSKIQFNSAVKATLSAPTSGTYKNILMAEAPNLAKSQFIFDDNLGFDMTGVIYLPSRDLVFNSGTTAKTRKMKLVVNTVTLNSVKWNMEPLEDGGSDTIEIRLVE